MKILNFKAFMESRKIKAINEGGGAGIEFSTNLPDLITIEFILSKGKLKNNAEDAIIVFDEIRAEGYADGGTGSDIPLSMEYNINNDALIEAFKNITIDDLVYGQGEDRVIDGFDKDEKWLEENLETTLYKLSYIEDIVIILELDNTKLSEMHFAGYIRGTFREGDSVFSNSDAYKDHSSVYINDIEFYKTRNYDGAWKGGKWVVTSGENTGTLEDAVLPVFNATPEFVDFYQDTFESDYEDDYEDEE